MFGSEHGPLYLPHSSSASRVTAAALGFFILSQSGERPERKKIAPALPITPIARDYSRASQSFLFASFLFARLTVNEARFLAPPTLVFGG
jgi:hypothetical protein